MCALAGGGEGEGDDDEMALALVNFEVNNLVEELLDQLEKEGGQHGARTGGGGSEGSDGESEAEEAEEEEEDDEDDEDDDDLGCRPFFFFVAALVLTFFVALKDPLYIFGADVGTNVLVSMAWAMSRQVL